MLVQSRGRPESSALEVLYLEHEARVRWVIRARGVPDGSVDDLVHESFVAIHRRWQHRDPSIPTATWVAGVARNVAFSHRRSEARRRQHLRAVPSPDAAPSPEDVVADREAWTALTAFTQSLSPKLREVFLLSEVGGMSVSDVGAITGVPVATLHSRLRLARVRFAAHFGAQPRATAQQAMLRRAAAEQEPPPEARRRSLAAFVASAGTAPLPVPLVAVTSIVAWKIAGLLVATAIVGMLITAAATAPDAMPSAPTRAQTVAAAPHSPPEDSTRSSVAAAIVSTPPSVSPPPARPPPAQLPPVQLPSQTPVRKGPPPPVSESTADRLATHVAALARARALTDGGQHAKALALLDALDEHDSTLARDHHRLVLRAACGAGRVERGRQAAGALAKLGLPTNLQAPCEPQKNAGTE